MLHDEILRWAGRGITIAWAAWVVVWLIAGLRTKPTIHRESPGSRLSYAVPLWASLVLFFVGRRAHWGARLLAAGAPTAWLYTRFIRVYPGVVWIGVPLVLAGLLIAVWARVYLAGNWSGSVTVKQDHELVRTGPYRYVRHPIYTGLLIAVAGTACAIGQIRGIMAFALVFIGLWHKSRIEERLMLATFGPAYVAYQASVRRLIPFIL